MQTTVCLNCGHDIHEKYACDARVASLIAGGGKQCGCTICIRPEVQTARALTALNNNLLPMIKELTNMIGNMHDLMLAAFPEAKATVEAQRAEYVRLQQEKENNERTAEATGSSSTTHEDNVSRETGVGESAISGGDDSEPGVGGSDEHGEGGGGTAEVLPFRAPDRPTEPGDGEPTEG